MPPVFASYLAILWVRITLAAALLGACFVGGCRVQGWRDEGRIASLRADLSQAESNHSKSIARGLERNAETVAALSDAAAKEVANAKKDAETFAQRADGLRAERGRLLGAITELASRTAADPAAGPAIGSEAASGPGLVSREWLVDLYRGADEEAASLAAAFDDAHARGLRCERLYAVAQDQLRKP